MNKFSLVIITNNEQLNIERCIRSVPTASEVIVMDSGSTDKTVDLAKSCGAKVIHQDWLGYGRQKQFAIEQATHDWVLLLDADEFANKELNDSIMKAMTQEHYKAFHLPIQEFFMNKVLTRGRGVTDPVRFHRKSCGKINSEEIHEKFETDAPISSLEGYALHYSATTALDRLKKILRDAELESKHHHWDINPGQIFTSSLRYFFSYLLKKKTYEDGFEGIVLLILYTFQMFIQNVSQYEKKLKKKQVE